MEALICQQGQQMRCLYQVVLWQQ
jgi:hypothetical protein